MRVGLRRVGLDLRPQALDVHVERLGVAEVVRAPDAVDQHVAGEHPAGVRQQELEQLELLERERHRDRRARTPRGAPASSAHVADLDDVGPVDARASTSPGPAAARRAPGRSARAAGTASSRSRRRRPRGRRPRRSRALRAVTMMIGTRDRERISRHTSMPEILGSITSSSTSAGCVASNRSSASAPSAAVSTRKPSRCSATASASRYDCSSSTTRIERRIGHRSSVRTPRTGRAPPLRDRRDESVNVEPSPSRDSTVTSPPCACATWRTIASPRPVPPVSRLRARSTR